MISLHASNQRSALVRRHKLPKSFRTVITFKIQIAQLSNLVLLLFIFVVDNDDNKAVIFCCFNGMDRILEDDRVASIRAAVLHRLAEGHEALALEHLDHETSARPELPRGEIERQLAQHDRARLVDRRHARQVRRHVRQHEIDRRAAQPHDFVEDTAVDPARLRDYILALRAIWDAWQNSTPLRYEGEFYQFTLMTPFFDPGPIPNPEVPVYIAGVGPGLSKMAGEVCDGFHVHPFHTVRYLDEVVLPAITKGAESNGRSLDDVTARVPEVVAVVRALRASSLVLDGEAGKAGGMGLCRQLKDEIFRCPPVLVLVGRREDLWLASWSEADAVLARPLDPLELQETVARLLRAPAEDRR